MFKVQCPQCSAPYQVDERRVPATGVNMRCPKCGQSFVVTRPDDMPALVEPRTGTTHSDASRLRPSDSTTMLGVAAPVGGVRSRAAAPEPSPGVSGGASAPSPFGNSPFANQASAAGGQDAGVGSAAAPNADLPRTAKAPAVVPRPGDPSLKRTLAGGAEPFNRADLVNRADLGASSPKPGGTAVGRLGVSVARAPIDIDFPEPAQGKPELPSVRPSRVGTGPVPGPHANQGAAPAAASRAAAGPAAASPTGVAPGAAPAPAAGPARTGANPGNLGLSGGALRAAPVPRVPPAASSTSDELPAALGGAAQDPELPAALGAGPRPAPPRPAPLGAAAPPRGAAPAAPRAAAVAAPRASSDSDDLPAALGFGPGAPALAPTATGFSSAPAPAQTSTSASIELSEADLDSLPAPVGGLDSVLPASVDPRRPSGAARVASAGRPEPTELPLPQEPDGDFGSGQWDDSAIALGEADLASLRPPAPAAETWSSQSDDAIDLPSPAADFDKELERTFDANEPSDFELGFSKPPAAPSVNPGAPMHLPHLPDLEPSASLRGRAATGNTGQLPAQRLDMDDEVFRLDSVPPSQQGRSLALSQPSFRAPAAAGHAAESGRTAAGLGAVNLDATGESPRAQQAGGTAYGELDLGSDAQRLSAIPAAPAYGQLDDDAEFGAIPEEDPKKPPAGGIGLDAAAGPAVTAAASAKVALGPAPAKEPKAAGGKRRGRVALATVLGLAVLGGSLALLPRVGPFGVYKIMDWVQADAHARELSSTSARIVELKQRDVFSQVEPALKLALSAQQQAPRYTALEAYAAFTHYALVVRFGGLPQTQASGRVLLDHVRAEEPEANLPYFQEAQAAEALLNKDYPAAERALKNVAQPGLEALILSAELALRQNDLLGAKALWEQAHARSAGPWTLFGLTRALFALRDPSAAAKAKEVLASNPEHVGAKLVLLELAAQQRDESSAQTWTDQVLKQQAQASPAELVLLGTLQGEIHLMRGRLSRAEAAFNEALKGEPRNARALVGLGQTQFRAGRIAAALAAYEAAHSTGGAQLQAALGIVQSQIALEMLEKARAVLAPLAAAHPKLPAIAYWQGRLEAAAGRKEEARLAYQRVITEGGQDPVVVDAVIALAQAHGEAGKFDDAARVLVEAQTRFPTSPTLHNALGQVALSQGRYEAALGEFESARKLDPEDITSLFNAGSALRRLRRYDEAWKAFESVAKIDAELPGLPLERGLLLEQSGKAVEALKEYETALAKTPNDLDLMLRVGCGRVGAGGGKEAEQILENVLKKRQRSAEAQHCLGRALFIQGRNLEALKRLQQAVDLDPQRAEYHMFVGWVANEAGQVAIAKRALMTALELDQGLADAYWQRGVLNLRQGGPADAVLDFKRALELNPERKAAYADLAQAQDQLGKPREALENWQKAIAYDDQNATWLFRYGKLLYNQHRGSDAAARLEKAITLGEKQTPTPVWLWEAHHLAAASLGGGERALAHWKRFLELSPQDSPYRTDAKRALRQAGQPWQGN